MNHRKIVVSPSCDNSWSLVDLVAIVELIIRKKLPEDAAEKHLEQIDLAVEDLVLYHNGESQFPADQILAASPRMILSSIPQIDRSTSLRDHVRGIRKLQQIARAFGFRPPDLGATVSNRVYGYHSHHSTTSRYYLHPIDEKILAAYLDWRRRQPRHGSAETM